MSSTSGWRGRVEPDFGQFYMLWAGAEWASADVPPGGIRDALWTNGSFVYVGTYRKFGTTSLEIDVVATAPTLPSSDWQHVVEVSLEAGGALEIFSWDAAEPAGVVSLPDKPVRLRVLWTGLVPGRFEGLDDEGHSDEQLAMSIWPSPMAEPEVLRRWHGWWDE